jgi:hypothetical protein
MSAEEVHGSLLRAPSLLMTFLGIKKKEVPCKKGLKFSSIVIK